MPLDVTENGRLDLQALLTLGREEQTEALAPLNRELDTMSAPERVRWAGGTCIVIQLRHSGRADAAPGEQ